MNRDADIAGFRSELEALGLGAHVDALLALARPAVRLVPQAAGESAVGIGRSRLGGLPDPLPDFEWPRSGAKWPDYGGELPQSFVAQIRLDELRDCEAAAALPGTGLLSFFYDSMQRVPGYDPADVDGWVIHHFENVDRLERRALPVDLPDEGRFDPVLLVPATETTYGPAECTEIEEVNLTGAEFGAYAGAVDSDDWPIHRLLGHPEPLQGDMQMECQLVSHGLYCGNERGWTDPRAAELAPGAREWRLLLQVDSDDDAGMMWGDGGRIYFWIHETALARREWARSRIVMQTG